MTTLFESDIEPRVAINPVWNAPLIIPAAEWRVGWRTSGYRLSKNIVP
jgi:hypothetical protein